MITIKINDELITISENSSLITLLTTYVIGVDNFAVAINRKFIPRSLHATTILHHGDQVELVAPMQGG